MAKKFFSKYTNAEIEALLDEANRTSETPFVLYYDKNNKVYRFFSTPAKQTQYEEAYLAGLVAGKGKSEYEFSEPFTAPSPNSMSIDLSPTERRYFIDSDSVVNLSFKFTTKEGDDVVKEAVDVYYTFDTPTGTRSVTELYPSDTTQATINIKSYLAVGDNSVTIVVKGRSTGASKTETIDFHILTLSLSSTFDVATSILPRSNFSVFFDLQGSAITKVVEAYIDGTRVATYTTTAASTTNREFKIANTAGTYTSGKHLLQIRASMYIAAISDTFYTPTYLYEFDIAGGSQTNVMIESAVAGSSIVPSDISLTAEQYVMKSITWGFYTSIESKKSGGSIRWELRQTGSSALVLMNEKTQLVENPNDQHQSPLQFVPTVAGTYELHAIYEKEGIPSEDLTPDGYTITIAQNTTGVVEATNNMVLKLTAIGRSNDEPTATVSSWSYTYQSDVDESENPVYTTYSTRFFNQVWSGSNGWNSNALCLGNGATCRIDAKPFAIDSGIVTNGCVFEIDFETYNVNDDNAVLLTIGQKDELANTPYLQITSQSATLVGSMKTTLVTNFKKNERVKIAFIVYPNAEITYGRSLFALINGIISQFVPYGSTENFNIGRLSDKSSTYGMVNIGNANADAGIKIYSIRAYSSIYTFAEGLSNFLIDQSGDNLSKAISRNDIYENQVITYRKLSTRITTLLIDGDLSKFLSGVIEADAVYAELTLTSPDSPDINFTCSNAKLTIAGQSTRGKPIPSMHVKLQDPSDNVVKDCDGVVIPNNRWAFRKGNAPEKKFRLQANYMDSSCCHNSSFLKLYNNIIENVTVNGQHVLMTPAQKFAKSFDEYDKNGYKEKMAAKYAGKEDPTGNNWAFPYNLKMVPDSIPCVVMWRKTKDDSYSFLGQYVIMEEKKSDFTSCKRSIYDTVDTAGNPDPFKFVASGGTRLWDNSACRQIEIVETNNVLPFFISASGWNEAITTESGTKPAHEVYFEMIYPDPDDIEEDYPSTGKSVEDYWTEFKNAFVDKVVATNPQNGGSQEAFNALYASGLFNRWHWASYYALMLRNCCVDSIVKNIELTTYDGVSWIPKWWDVDMQCGLEQTAECDVPPRTNRTTEKDSINHVYYFDGRFYQNGKLVSSWLWDALENCPQFQSDVRTIDDALYAAGWTYDKITEIQDDDYVGKWAETVYNESQMAKYMDVEGAAECALYVQGDRTPHRHWFLKTSYDYYDAKNVCGDYKNVVIRMRTFGATTGNKITVTPSEDSYFAWGILNTPRATGIVGKRGEPLDIVITMEGGAATSTSNPLIIYNATKISKLDLSDIARTIQGEVYFNQATDASGTNNITTMVLGMASNAALSSSNGFNISPGYGEGLVGMSTMTRVEEYSVRGMYSFKKPSVLGIENMTELRKFYAAGTQLTEFSAARGAPIEELELPTTILTLSLNGSNLTDSNENCLIKWFKTNTTVSDIVTTVSPSFDTFIMEYGDGTTDSIASIPVSSVTFETTAASSFSNQQKLNVEAFSKDEGAVIPTGIVQTTVPASLKTLEFIGMGSDVGAQKLIVDWVRAVDSNPSYSFDNCSLTYRSMSWYGLQLADLMRIAKIPKEYRTKFDGYIRCDAGTEGFTTQQMNEIISAFGSNVFDKTSSLCIDCSSNVIIISAETNADVSIDAAGVINVMQGGQCKLKAAGFPLVSDGVTYVWSVVVNGEPVTGTEQNPTVYFDEHSLNCTTGVINTTECYELDKEYTFRVTKQVAGSSDVSTKNITVRIKARTYPNKSEIVYASQNPVITEGVYQFINGGDYYFDALFTNTTSMSFDGTLSASNGGQWTLSSLCAYGDYITVAPDDAQLHDGKTNDTELVLRVKKLPDVEMYIKLSHVSNWKNRLVLTSDYMTLCFASNIPNVLRYDDSYGNNAMFLALEKAGFVHAAAQSYTSHELKYIPTGKTLNMFELLTSVGETAVDDFVYLSSATYDGSSKFNVLQFLKNVEVLNLSGCYALQRTLEKWGTTLTNVVNIEGMTNYLVLNMAGTGEGLGVNIGANSKLRTLRYGTPYCVDVVTPESLANSSISFDSTSALRSVRYSSLKNNSTFKGYTDILKSGSQSLTSVCLTGGTLAKQETVDGLDIELMASKMASLAALEDSEVSVKGYISSTYAYDDSVAALNLVPNLHVARAYRYIRWTDSAFENAVSHGVVGDGVGVSDARANAVTKLFGDIRGNTAIANMSDFGYFSSFVFSSYPSPLSSEFYGCTGLTTIVIPSATPYIGRYSFTTQPNLVNVAINDCTNLSSVETSAFVGCYGVLNGFDLTKSAATLVSADVRGVPNIPYFTLSGAEDCETLII